MANLIGDRLAMARERAGLTQAELASRSRVSQPQICALEAGKHSNPGVATLGRLELALGLSHGALSRPPPKRKRRARGAA